MENDAARMHPLTLRFTDAGLDQAFGEEQARKSVKPFRAAMVALSVVVLVVWALLPDILPQVPDARTRFRVPILILLSILAYGYGRSYTRSFIGRQQFILLAGTWGLAMALIGICSLMQRAALDATGLVIVVIHTLNTYSISRLRFVGACYGAWGTMAFYLGYLSYTGALDGTALARHASVLLCANLFGMIAGYQIDQSARREFLAMRLLGQERDRSERLLLNILPTAIAERLKTSSESIADHSAEVTVLFADIVGFTPLSANKSPQDLVRLLDRIFSEFDALAEKHGLEKIKTIGDAYMAAAGLPERRADHAPAAARMAVDMLAAVARIAADTGEALALRIGLNSGPVVAGVIGRKKFIYDMWGDTVNTASRMESHGVSGAVQCSEATATLLRPVFELQARGAVQVEGKGEMQTYLLVQT
jgi:class 3 adenylate cyclase